MEWISVKDRLPNFREDSFSSDDVLVIYDTGKMAVRRYFFYDFFWEIIDGDHEYDEITHWMPLPQPPKDEHGMD